MSEFPESTPNVSPEIAALLENLQKNKTTLSTTGKNTTVATNSRQNASSLKETTSSSSSSSSSSQQVNQMSQILYCVYYKVY